MPIKERYSKDPEAYRDWTRRYYWAHREERLEYARRYREKNRSTLNRKITLQQFRIKEDAFTVLNEAQQGLCAVCRNPPAGNKVLHVDHDHVTGEIRGLLCHMCNCAIGNARESAARLRELAAYLEKPKPSVEKLPPVRPYRKRSPERD